MLIAATFCLPIVARAGEFDLLDRSQPEISQMLRNHFRRLAHEALDRRLEQYELLKTPEQIASWQKVQRQRFRELLGGFPERTPLNARVDGKLSGDGFRAEKVIYESRPGFLVTATLYLPESPAPYPGVLFPCGHSENGKAAANYQKACMLLAKNGCAALIFDPPGQGERKQVLGIHDEDHASGAAPFKSTSEHMVTGVAPVLLGQNLATHFVWDGMRGIDYLQSRDDIIADRIGCTGSSGGGNQTAFLMALDERVVAAAPGNFITTTRIKNDRPGPGDAEQNIFGQTKYGIDHPDFLLMRAPKPTLILAATQDFVPIEGSWIAYRQAKRLYSKLGLPERVSLVETDDKHGYNAELRVAMVRWMRRWLLDTDDAITDEELTPFSDKQLQCTPKGQTLLVDGAKSIFDLNREEERRLARKRANPTEDFAFSNMSAELRRSVIQEVADIGERFDLHEFSGEQLSSVMKDGYQVQRFVFKTSAELKLPALLFVPNLSTGKATLYLHDEGKTAEAGTDGEIVRLVKSGQTVLAIDVAGCGETQMKPWRYGSMSGVLGPNSAEFYVAYMLGQSFVGLRGDQIHAATRWLLGRHRKFKKVDLIANGELTVPALHVAVLEPDLFGKIEFRGGLDSWKSVIDTLVTERQLVNVVHGVLRHYDLPDLRAMIPKGRLTVTEPRDAAGKSLQHPIGK
jgi:cephalosporin-C deacetylase-like acetyl esterase